uniref:Uncharacterized protein n=1 Tax=Fibrocapsa japonica TaxID=94617 RepID=A0A7S2UUH4_9STRA|mmetsp:Transcript_13995/g.20636  ORF Transcript_13995/g.20636 Transcript_13995/m.20636 type:complete len:442 (+) Transcript_13995:317-1642(+)|eukprot:CAMPEP_0113936778 /NCGR_PEP_ID=MMETSP1339-20121228/3577_1 /TAXON_ID=94617 /ORGANISM="Fibrocapsa japonica" /LENGTH=441 /DNA_ID=CAMNT_0000939329 /DNA_START=243 /DNA_END=1568 /DNA_ORIENTATION=- /assembly_acc=CAM_ASM_000762
MATIGYGESSAQQSNIPGNLGQGFGFYNGKGGKLSSGGLFASAARPLMPSGPAPDQAKRTKVLHLSMRGLEQIPRAVFTQLTGLVRLDLSFNNIVELSPDLGLLTLLEQLWVNDNPLVGLPPEIHLCKKLKEIDLCNTNITTVPREVGRLKYLMKVDLRGTPLKQKLVGFTEDTDGLMEYLRVKDARKTYKLELTDALNRGLYRETADTAEGKLLLTALVKAISLEFRDLEELRNLVRNSERLFPADLQKARYPQKAVAEVRRRFSELKKKNQMKKLSADLELKLRVIYYDRLELSEVEIYIRDIYDHMTQVEDVQFLIKYAPSLLPPNAEDIDGAEVKQAMLRLQDELTAARKAVEENLFQSLSSVYSDREPSQVRELMLGVAKLFQRERFCTKKEEEELKKLSADAPMLFPAEFQAANPEEIRKEFRRREKASAAAQYV